ncbi:MAG: hypothetical protein Q8K61_08165 [Gallionella sp.]|nr:hypothetical protein [Gallionella sp.]
MNTKKSDKDVAAKPVAAKPLTAASKVSKPVAKVAAVKKAEPVAVKVTKEVKKVPEVKEVKAAKAVKEVKVAKKPKPKVVRDSFTMPQSEYQKIADIKEIGLKSGLQVKKSEVLRAGVLALCAMNEAQLIAALSGLDKIKTGRPNKH